MGRDTSHITVIDLIVPGVYPLNMGANGKYSISQTSTCSKAAQGAVHLDENIQQGTRAGYRMRFKRNHAGPTYITHEAL